MRGVTQWWPYLVAISIVTVRLVWMAWFESSSQLDSKTSHDLAPGSSLSLPSVDELGRLIDPRVRSLLVYAGSCSSCSKRALDMPRLSHAPFAQVIFLYDASRQEVVGLDGLKEDKVRAIADPKGDLVQRLGAVSAPRFYIWQHGKILTIWKETDTWPDAWLR